MKWFTFQDHEWLDDNDLVAHDSYAAAKSHVQGSGQTETSPRRCGKQFYELRGSSGNTYIIATEEAILRCGYEFDTFAAASPLAHSPEAKEQK